MTKDRATWTKKEEGTKGMFMDCIYLIMFMTLFILMNLLKRNLVNVLR